jgi:hypothetical protein
MPQIIRNIRGFHASENSNLKKELLPPTLVNEVVFTKADKEFLDYLRKYHKELDNKPTKSPQKNKVKKQI